MENPSVGRENSRNVFTSFKNLNRKGCNKGFTLIELFIVIAIIGTLSAIAVPNYLGYKNKAMIMVAVTDIKMIEKQIALYVFQNEGQYPDSLNDLTTIGAIRDPWGNPYQYQRIIGEKLTGKDHIEPRKDHNTHPVNSDYDLCSMGKDGKSHKNFTNPSSQDDVVHANDGGYVGLVSNY